MRTDRQSRRGSGREGYALIMVLFGAAVAAVMLARALPRDAMSAQRVREERLIHHGKEYSRAIKLYFREHKKYPKKIEDLEKTDRVRYLRRRYKDPITGEDEWRLIHMGTDGRFKDSLLYDLEDEEGEGGADGVGGRPSRFGGNRARASGRNPMQAGGAAMTAFDGGARALQERDSAAPDNPFDRSSQGPYGGLFPGQESPAGEEPAVGPDGQPLPPDYSRVRPGEVPFDAGQLPPEQMANQQAMQAAAQTPRGAFGGRRDARQNPFAAAAGQAQPQTPQMGFGAAGGVPPQAADVIQRLLTTPRPGGLAGLRGGQNPMQGMQGQQGMAQFEEGIAGVASKSVSKGVKVFQGEETFNLWEFVYDYRKDEQMAGVMAGMAPGGAGTMPQGQPGVSSDGTLGGAPGMPGIPGMPSVPGGSGVPAGFGGAQPGGAPMGGPVDPGASGFGNPASGPPITPPAGGVGTRPMQRPLRGTGGAGEPGVVPALPGQQLTEPNAQQEQLIQQMLQQQQQQPQP